MTKLHWLTGRSWLRITTKLIVLGRCNWQLPCVGSTIMADTTMTDNLDASQQVLAAFQQLAPLMGVKTDPDLILSQNPSQPKRAKKDVAPGRRMVKQDEGSTALQDAVMLMARLLVRHDQALQEAQKETAFLFFFNNKAPTGSLKCLMAAAEGIRRQHSSHVLRHGSPFDNGCYRRCWRTCSPD